MVISPELADVLSTIITRIRDGDGRFPLAVAYDYGEKTWNPPMPLLFQWRYGLENRPLSPAAIRNFLNTALADADAILVAAAKAGAHLEDLVQLAAEMYTRSLPESDEDGDRLDEAFEDRLSGLRPRSTAPGSSPAISPLSARRW